MIWIKKNAILNARSPCSYLPSHFPSFALPIIRTPHCPLPQSQSTLPTIIRSFSDYHSFIILFQSTHLAPSRLSAAPPVHPEKSKKINQNLHVPRYSLSPSYSNSLPLTVPFSNRDFVHPYLFHRSRTDSGPPSINIGAEPAICYFVV
jgi:hypothetical protein